MIYLMKNALKNLLLNLSGSIFLFSGCAVLHHVQVGQIDSRGSDAFIPFEVMVSETGVDVQEAGRIARATETKQGDRLGDLAAIISLFQMGPRTGAPVYNQGYAEKVVYQIYEKCPSGRVTGLMSIREMRKYPVISGEIVKITGYCRKSKVKPQLDSKAEYSDFSEIL